MYNTWGLFKFSTGYPSANTIFKNISIVLIRKNCEYIIIINIMTIIIIIYIID